MSDKETKADLWSMLTSLVLNTAISTGFFIGFSLLRPLNAVVYEPRLVFAPDSKKPPPLEKSISSWILPTLFTDEMKHIGSIGPDATMFLRFVRFCLKLFGIFSLIAVPLTVFHGLYVRYNPPATSAAPKDDLGLNPTLSVLTITSVAHTPALFWIHCILAYAVTIYIYLELYFLWEEYFRMRRQYSLSSDFQASLHNRTLLLTDVAAGMQKQEAIDAYVHKFVPNAPISSIVIGRNLVKLPDLVKQHETFTRKLEHAFVKFFADPKRERPTHSEGGYLGFIGGERVDSIEFYGNKLRELEAQIYALRMQPDDHFGANSSAFVAFHSIKAASTAASKLEKPQLFMPTVKLSPDFDDIIWANLAITPSVRKTRSLIAYGITAATVLGWTTLTLFVVAVTSIASLSRNPAIRQFLTQNEGFVGFLQAILTGIPAIMNILLPIVLRFVAEIQGVRSLSGRERSVLYKYFLYQTYQVVLRLAAKAFSEQVAIGSGFDKTFSDLNKIDPTLLFKKSMSQVLDNSTYYISIIASGFTFYGVAIIQAYPFVMSYIRHWFFNTTPRQIHENSEPPQFDYMQMYGFLLYLFLPGLAFSIVAPLIVPFAAIMFFIAYVCTKYQIFYVYETKIETAGSWWPKVFNMICVAVGSFQVVTFGVLLVYTQMVSYTSVFNGRLQYLLVGCLPFFTVAYWFFIRYMIGNRARYIAAGDGKSDESYFSHDEVPSSERLEDRAFNPALVKPLLKVWVKPEDERMLPKFYSPVYEDLHHYLRINHPELMNDENLEAYSRRLQVLNKNQKEHEQYVARRQTQITPRFSAGHDFEQKPPVPPARRSSIPSPITVSPHSDISIQSRGQALSPQGGQVHYYGHIPVVAGPPSMVLQHQQQPQAVRMFPTGQPASPPAGHQMNVNQHPYGNMSPQVMRLSPVMQRQPQQQYMQYHQISPVNANPYVLSPVAVTSTVLTNEPGEMTLPYPLANPQPQQETSLSERQERIQTIFADETRPVISPRSNSLSLPAPELPLESALSSQEPLEVPKDILPPVASTELNLDFEFSKQGDFQIR